MKTPFKITHFYTLKYGPRDTQPYWPDLQAFDWLKWVWEFSLILRRWVWNLGSEWLYFFGQQSGLRLTCSKPMRFKLLRSWNKEVCTERADISNEDALDCCGELVHQSNHVPLSKSYPGYDLAKKIVAKLYSGYDLAKSYPWYGLSYDFHRYHLAEDMAWLLSMTRV